METSLARYGNCIYTKDVHTQIGTKSIHGLGLAFYPVSQPWLMSKTLFVQSVDSAKCIGRVTRPILVISELITLLQAWELAQVVWKLAYVVRYFLPMVPQLSKHTNMLCFG
jgi:hypothetical protein